MQKIPRTDLKLESRQRSGELESFRDTDLRNSILTKGLLHPPVVIYRAATRDYLLVAGGRRLAQIDWIAEDGQYFLCNDETILPGEVPTINVSTELSSTSLMEAEFEENFIRHDPPWQDRVRALAAIHAARVAENPKQTFIATGRELAEAGGVALGGGTHPTAISANLADATLIAKHLDNPVVRKARNANEAYQIVVGQQVASFQAEYIRRKEAEAGRKPGPPPDGAQGALSTLLRSWEVKNADSLALLPTLPASSFDLILSDPPYATNAGSSGFRSRTVHHHNYDDSPEYARDFIQGLLLEGFRITKARANLFLFTSIKLWDWLYQAAAAAGWSCFPSPIIWAKSDSEGLAPWGRQGFRRTYDLIFFATKGARGLIHSPVDILRYPRVPRDQRDYGAAKPVPLMRALIECSTLPGDSVIDACCGSGATLLAAQASGRKSLGIDLDKAACDLATVKLTGGENAARGTDPTGDGRSTEPSGDDSHRTTDPGIEAL